MKKGKLNLDKKAIAKLSQENLENLQGGGSFTCPSAVCCTHVSVSFDSDASESDSSVADPGVSCGV